MTYREAMALFEELGARAFDALCLELSKPAVIKWRYELHTRG